MAKEGPQNNFKEFETACRRGRKVRCIDDVLEDAERDFNMHGEDAILSFIGNSGLERMEHINTKPLEKSPFQAEVLVDAYHFRTAGKLGYLAFYRSPKTSYWIVKSFHLSTARSMIMEEALRRAGLITTPREKLGEGHEDNNE